jgi:hypothetical protein
MIDINQRGLDTVEKAIPIYAPSTDGNNEQRYIEHVHQLVNDWMSEDTQLSGQPTAALLENLLRATFSAVGSQFKPDQAFHQYYLNEVKAGRPLGNPLSEQRTITINGQAYVMQVFALDTIYAPVPRWNDIGRLSDLLKG